MDFCFSSCRLLLKSSPLSDICKEDWGNIVYLSPSSVWIGGYLTWLAGIVCGFDVIVVIPRRNETS